MAKTGYQIVHRLTAAEITTQGSNLSGGVIEEVGTNGVPTGVVYNTGAAGVAPQQIATTTSSLPTYHTAATQAAMLALSSAKVGDFCLRSDLSNDKRFYLKATGPSVLANWEQFTDDWDTAKQADLDSKKVDLTQGHPYTTAANTSGYIITANSEFSTSYEGWKAFQLSPSSSSEWATNGVTTNIWVRVELPYPQIFTKFTGKGRSAGIEYLGANWKIQGSQDGTTFTDLYTDAAVLNTERSVTFTNTVAYKYYRIFSATTVGSNPGLGLARFYTPESAYAQETLALKVTKPNIVGTETLVGQLINGKEKYARYLTGTTPAAAGNAVLFTPSTGATSRLLGAEGTVARSGSTQRHPIDSIVTTDTAHVGIVYQDTTTGAIQMYHNNASFASQAYEIVVYYTK